MAEKKEQKTQGKKTDQKHPEKKEKPYKEKEKKQPEKEILEESLLRIAGYDVPGSRNIYAGLTRIKGVSWSISNAACISLGFDKSRKISSLSKDEITNIEQFLKNPNISDFLKNRRFDLETGETKHYVGADLDFRKDFDIRRMKKIRSYKGIRHTMNQPVRGQKTRSHFRKSGRAVGVKKGNNDKKK
jgi:small subunit ribosomal protein S13